MVWVVNQQFVRAKRKRIWVGSFLCWILIMLITPKIPLSPQNHLFADKRNFLGVPNTMNVITNFPFLIVGVLGFVLCVGGGFFNISFGGEIWCWAFYYAGIAGLAFGSAYYHLKPDDSRVIWDTLPILIAYSSLFSSFLIERVSERVGFICLISLLSVAMLSVAYARAFNDLRLCTMFQLIPCIAIPVMTFLVPPKYSHSIFWLWASGADILSKFEALTDKKIYNADRYFISGHSLSHLFSAAAPILLTVMLLYRSSRFHRLSDLKGRP